MPSSPKKKKTESTEKKKKATSEASKTRRHRASSSGDNLVMETPEKNDSSLKREVKSTTAKTRKSSRLGTTSILETLDTQASSPQATQSTKAPRTSPRKKKPQKTQEDARTPIITIDKVEKIESPASSKKKRSRSKQPPTTDVEPEPMETDADNQDEEEQKESPMEDVEASAEPVKKADPVMDVRVHRLRHLGYIPSPILAIASSPDNDNEGYLAISRQDGSYELRVVSSMQEYTNQIAPHIYPVTTLAGSTLVVAHSLCWVPNKASEGRKPTCVAASPDGTIWAVNFSKSQLQSRFSSGGGGVFDLASCHSSDLPVVAAACEDGFVRFWQVAPNGTILDPPVATLTTAGSAILSLAWRLISKQANGKYETVLFAGVADGTIRKYKVDLSFNDDVVMMKKQKSLLRMTMESKGRRASTKIWALKILGDGTLVSGNSLGQVQFWNTDNGTLIQSIFQSNLKADVLQLAVNKDETKVFCTGVDSRVVCCERPANFNQNDPTPWILTNAQRPHTHDVKAMTIVMSDDGRIETLATGGDDTKLCSYVVSEFSKRRPQVWYPWPSDSPVSASSEHRVFSMRRKSHVELYRLESDESVAKAVTRKATSDKVGTIKLQTKSSLVASSLSSNGKWMAISDASSLMLFSLKLDNEKVEPKRMQLPDTLVSVAATAIHFDEDVLYLTEASTSRIYIINMGTMDHTIIPVPASENSLPIHAIQTCGNFLVTLSHSPSSGVNIFCRTSESLVTYKHFWTVPSLSQARTAAMATIAPTNQLAIATFCSKVYVFDMAKRRLSPWSESNGFPITEWPSELVGRRDFPVRLLSNPSDPTQLIMASFGTFCVMSLKDKLPKNCRMLPEAHVRRRQSQKQASGGNPYQGRPQKRTKKITKNDDPNAKNCTICLHYNSMLHMDFLTPREMIVVEQPWLQVVASFPEAVQRRVYGVH